VKARCMSAFGAVTVPKRPVEAPSVADDQLMSLSPNFVDPHGDSDSFETRSHDSSFGSRASLDIGPWDSDTAI
jgi:hypothetical protein